MSEGDELLATVIRVDARQCEVSLEGRVVSAMLRGRLFEVYREDRLPVAVGDRVRLVREGEEHAIEEVLPRRNFFARRAAGEDLRRQILAANVDQVVAVCSFGYPPFSSVTADRILCAAHFHGLPAVLVLNKTDKARLRQVEAIRATYEGAGYRVLPTSAERGEGIEALGACLADRVSVFYGLSGTGKSSLLNCIEPGLGLRTREVSAALRSGRHTTAYARLYPLRMGGAVIDTPGVRVFRPYGIPPHELRLHFPEFVEPGRRCRFPACLHRQEPGCAVRGQVEAGAIPESRWRSYLEILDELEEVFGGQGMVED